MNQTHLKCSKEGQGCAIYELLSSSPCLSAYEEKRIHEQAAGSSLLRKISPSHSLLNFFIAVISSLIDTISPPLSTIGGLLHLRGKTISSTGSTSFSVRLWRESVRRGNKLCVSFCGLQVNTLERRLCVRGEKQEGGLVFFGQPVRRKDGDQPSIAWLCRERWRSGRSEQQG